MLCFILYTILDPILLLRGLFSNIQQSLSFIVTPLAFFTWIFHTLFTEHEERPRFPTEPNAIVPRNRYELPWHMLYVYGALFFFSATEGIGFTLGFLASLLMQVGDVSSLNILRLPITIFGFIVIYHIGIWIGKRTELSFVLGVVIVFSIVITSIIFSKMLEFIAIPILLSEEFFYNLNNDYPTMKLFFYHLWYGFLGNSLFGILGFCIGWKNHLTGYMNFLLRRIPKNIRKDFVDLAYEEAQKTMKHRKQ